MKKKPSKKKPISTVAKIGFLGTVAAAIVTGVFQLLQPLATSIVDDYRNQTTDIQIADVRAAVTEGKPTIDIVLSNSTSVAQVVVLIEIALRQEGLPTAFIDKSVYNINGSILLNRNSGAVKGSLETDGGVSYPFEGVLDVHSRGTWNLLLSVPVRETLEPGDSRSILIVIPSKLRVRPGNWLSHSISLDVVPVEKYFRAERTEFMVTDFLKGRGNTTARIRAKRGDGKLIEYQGTLFF